MDDQNNLQGRKAGFIGLGVMGKPMARNLQAAGAQVFIHNRSQEVVRELAAEGMTAPGDLQSLAKAVGKDGPIILMLPDPPAVDAVMRGKNGLLDALEPGSLVADMSSTSVKLTRELAELLRERDCVWVDAPVSGGETGAIAGTLTIMAGGTEAAFERVRPFFEAMAKSVNHMGASGAGQVTKLANQVIVALTIDAVAEALILAEGAGVDPAKVRHALMGGFADSRILDLHGERMVNRSFKPGGRTTLQLKDLRNAHELMTDCGLHLPTLEASLKLWQGMIDRGKGDLDHSGLFTLFDGQLDDARPVIEKK